MVVILENSFYSLLINLIIYFPYDSAIPLLAIYIGEMKLIFTHIFIH